MEIYKGNSVPISIDAKYKDKTEYVFKQGDIVKLGIKKYLEDTKYVYEETKEITEGVAKVNFDIPPKETKKLLGNYVIESKLTYNNGKDVSTLFQEQFIVKGVVINE